MRYFYRGPDSQVYEFESDDDARTYGPDGLVRMNKSEVENHINPPPVAPTAEDVIAERDRLLAIASILISPFQDAVDIGDASDDESKMLIEWKKYRIALNRISTQPGFPESIDWPVHPS